MIKAFAQTENLPLAAALGVCGVPIATEPMLDEKTGKVRSAVRLGEESVGTDREMDTRTILQGILQGTIEDTDPQHPVLAALWAIHNDGRLARMDWFGERYRLVPVPKAARSYYDDEPADSLESAKGRALLRTRDRKVAAAFGVVGVPVVEVEPGSARGWVLWAEGMPLVNPRMQAETVDAVDLLARFRDGRLSREDPWHPFLLGVQAIEALENLRTLMDTGEKWVALRPPGTNRKALIFENCSDRQLDRVAKFLRV